MYLMENIMLENAVRIISLQPMLNDYVAEKKHDREKVVWISNGVDIGRYNRLKGKLAPITRPKHWSLCIAYHGAMGNANDLFFLLKSFREYEIRYPALKKSVSAS